MSHQLPHIAECNLFTSLQMNEGGVHHLHHCTILHIAFIYPVIQFCVVLCLYVCVGVYHGALFL